MSRPTQTIQATNAGTSKTCSQKELEDLQSGVVTREEITEFLNAITVAPQMGDDHIEASRKVCEHYNRHNLKGFEQAGYFIFNGVKVYEKGKKNAADTKDRRTMEEINHPKG